jgi:hypothetical protein
MEDMSAALNRLFRRLTFCANRELLYDLYPYVWDMRGVVSLLNSYVKWLGKMALIILDTVFSLDFIMQGIFFCENTHYEFFIATSFYC